MGVENFECPVSHRRYLWFSKYFDDSLFTEFENSGKENDFNDIDKENLKEFGLIGHGSKIWFNTDDGVLQLLNPGEEVAKTFGFYILTEGAKLIKISNRNDRRYNDIIQYKFGGIDLDPSGKETTGLMSADQHLFGYKTTIETDAGKLHFKVIFTLDLTGKPCSISMKISPEFNLMGILVVSFNNIPAAPTELNIAKGSSANTVKLLNSVNG